MERGFGLLGWLLEGFQKAALRDRSSEDMSTFPSGPKMKSSETLRQEESWESAGGPPAPAAQGGTPRPRPLPGAVGGAQPLPCGAIEESVDFRMGVASGRALYKGAGARPFQEDPAAEGIGFEGVFLLQTQQQDRPRALAF